MRLRIIRLDPNRRAVSRHRVSHLPPHEQRDPQIAVRLRIVRLERNRLAIRGDRLVHPPRGPIRFAEVRVIRATARIPLDRLADQLDRRVIPPGLMRDHAEKMQRVGMFGRDRQDLPIDRFRLRQTPGLMLFNGQLHRLINRHLRHRRPSITEAGPGRFLTLSDAV